MITQVTWAIIKRWPHTLIIPFAVFGLLVGLGVWGVFAAADNEGQNQRNTATGVMTDAATGFEVSAELLDASALCVHWSSTVGRTGLHLHDPIAPSQHWPPQHGLHCA